MESAHQLSFRPDCSNTAEVPSFTLRTALSAIPLVSDRRGVDVQWFQEDIPKLCQIPKNCQCKWLLVPFRVPGTFVSFSGFLVKFCFLHGYAWIHWVARSCTTTAYRWLFRDSQLSLRTLWSAAIKSPKFAARGTASPLRLLRSKPTLAKPIHFWPKLEVSGWWFANLGQSIFFCVVVVVGFGVG